MVISKDILLKKILKLTSCENYEIKGYERNR